MSAFETVWIDRKRDSSFDMEDSAEDIRRYRRDGRKVGECIIGRQKWSRADWKVAVLPSW